MLKRTFFFLMITVLPSLGYTQYNIEVKVEQVPSSDGNINIALYDTDGSFLNTESAFYSMSVNALKGTTTLVLNDIPNGTYAIALYHDVDANNELKTKFPKKRWLFPTPR